ncbi:MAG TPA: ABC transporter ATP-binding protein [Bacteroidia bacterium]|nr:ABC transporter ATP-binding protein [Bacteroidia bacterium]
MTFLLDVNQLSIDLSVKGSRRNLVHDISFTVEQGRTLGIVGESGSGKSLICYSMLGLLTSKKFEVVSGSALFKDRTDNQIDLLEKKANNAQRMRGQEISMIFQEPMTSLNPVLPCGLQIEEAIREGKISKSEKKNRVLDLLKQVRLPDPERVYKSYPHEISGGQKQRVVIAMALAGNPSLLIADEPTTALDVTVQASVLRLINDLKQQRNMAVIFITHDLGVVKEVADDVLVLRKGKVMEYGNVNQILNHPNNQYTKDLIACRKILQSGSKDRLPTLNQAETVLKEKVKKMAHAEILTEPPILKVEKLSKYYFEKVFFSKNETPSVKAVDEISFELYKGQTLGIVGESGCGKTTLGRTILNLVEPSTGKVWYEGVDITSYSKKEWHTLRKDIQIIFQDPYASLNPRLSIKQILLEPIQVHQIGNNDVDRIKKVTDMLEKVGLSSDVLNRYPHEFSGGQRQRICIARSLVLEPKLVVCDESVSALDVSVQAQVLNLLNDLKKEFKLTYIFISHDLSVVNYMSDTILVMYKGNRIEMGPANEVYLHPQNEYTQKLINSAPLL